MRILFSDEKMFDIDGIYNSQNDRVWAVDCTEGHKKGRIKQKGKFPQKSHSLAGSMFERGITAGNFGSRNIESHSIYSKKNTSRGS